jgi:uncharacterized protein (DUF1697 family)
VPKYAAFLGGINVGGHRVKNDELRLQFEAMGFQEVNTFRASGNVVFAVHSGPPSRSSGPPSRSSGPPSRSSGLPSGSGPPIESTGPFGELTDRIEQGLAEWLGYKVPTFLRTADEVRTIASHAPFAEAQVQASRGKLQVALLSTPPIARARKDVLALSTEDDMLALGQRELYWLPSGGILDSALDLKAIATLLGPMTLRTKGTVEQIAGKHLAGAG